ncbi:hydrolase [Pseudoalteromonas sp. S201]|uniref:TatD family hydrolase n=1 Tax=unclassified Pseudoalteromonas TaxID=194690 RepID=UPI00110BBE54|nr:MULTISPECIES: TatD family hydrolase [unclassified Pseudoalteromonas]TMP52299.1 hydrolase [Pseudoalteromonas sp. S1688]TMS92364.1 hydrolase [Pseudoalteromonas sp. S201]
MKFIDSHCHLDFSEFDANRESLINACVAKGVSQFIVPGISLAQSQNLLEFKATYPQVSIAAGLHPYFLEQHQQSHLESLFNFAKANKTQLVAIGECGLDRSISNLEKQTFLFEQQIALANELDLPLIVHHRQSHDLIAQSFKRCRPKNGGVLHAFSGSIQQAHYYIKQGFKLGVGGVITYGRAAKTRAVIAKLEPQHLVLETDSPSMPLSGYQGEINTPLHIPNVFDALYGLKPNSDKFQLAEQLYDSCSDVFCI